MQISPYIKLTRPLNTAITFASVCAAAFISAPASNIDWLQVILGALAAAIIAAGGNVHNDVLDIEVDKINRPERPLPQGLLSKRAASNFSAMLLTIGIFIGFFLGQIPSLITLTAALLLIVYNFKLKMTPLAGNIAISALTALAFIFGGVLAGDACGGIIPAVFSLFFHFSREMVKDIQDIEGDKARPGATFARKYGVETASVIAALAMFILLLIVPLPYFANLYNYKYLIISSIGVEIPLVWAVYAVLRKGSKRLAVVSKVLKFGMAMGLVSLIAGR